MNMINAVLVGGASILCGQFLGKNQVNRTRSVFTLDVLMVCGVGAALTVLCLVIPGGVSYFLGARGEMVERVAQYIQGYAFGFIAIIRYAGDTGMAAYAAIGTFGGLYFATIAGVAASSRMLISIYSGEEDRAGLVAIMKTALYKGIGLATVANFVFIALATPITHIFYQDPLAEVYQLALWGFRLFPISMVLACFNLIFCNCFQCTNRVRIVNALSVIDGLVGTVLTAAICYPLLRGMGIWVTQVVNGFYAIIIIIVHAWVINKNFAMDTESLMTLSKDFGVSKDRRMELTITSLEEVVHTSEQIIEFCRRHQIDKTRSYYAGLCIEEMAGNIVEHGFDDKKKHSVDIRVVYKEDGELLLRLRDDCKPFNPQERAELFDPEDITHNIGLRMVSRIAKGMEYQNMLGLNVLTITV